MTENPSQTKPVVLYVDDDNQNLVVFRVGFQQHFKVLTAPSGEEGLKILDANPDIAVVVSDQRMPGMSGAEFLNHVRERAPQTVRMAITAYTSFNDAVESINSGRVTRFISKPWRPKELLADIQKAAELYQKTVENQRLRQQILDRERSAAVGKVVSGFVHELSNVAVVLSTVDDLYEEYAEGADIREELKGLCLGVSKLELLVDALRLCAHGHRELKLSAESVDLVEVVEHALELCRLFPVVRQLELLHFESPQQPVRLSLDRAKFDQVILNLVKNAAEACHENQGQVRLRLALQDDTAQLEVSDNGPGIPKEKQDKIWQDFYTTKGDTGTGLGLAVSQRIIQAHGGRIHLKSIESQGASFTIEMPVTAQAPAARLP